MMGKVSGEVMTEEGDTVVRHDIPKKQRRKNASGDKEKVM